MQQDVVRKEADDKHKLRLQELYDRHEADGWKIIAANHDAFDKQVLTLSTAFLALSVTFLKDIIKAPSTAQLWLLYGSWIAFGVAVTATMFSFLISNQAVKRHIYFCEQWYLKQDKKFENKRSRWNKTLAVVNWSSAIAFFLGIVLTIIFCIGNAGYTQKKVAETPSVQRPQVVFEMPSVVANSKVDLIIEASQIQSDSQSSIGGVESHE